MEVHPGGIVLFLGLVFLSATILSMAVLLLLTYVKIIRLKRRSEFITWALVGGIFVSFIFVTMQCNSTSHNMETVIVKDSLNTHQPR